jgi:hypothetical protein
LSSSFNMGKPINRVLVILVESANRLDFLTLASAIQTEGAHLGYSVFFFIIPGQIDNITSFLDQAKGDCYLISEDLGIGSIVEELMWYPKPVGLLQTTFRDSFFANEESKETFIANNARSAIRTLHLSHKF